MSKYVIVFHYPAGYTAFVGNGSYVHQGENMLSLLKTIKKQNDTKLTDLPKQQLHDWSRVVQMLLRITRLRRSTMIYSVADLYNRLDVIPEILHLLNNKENFTKSIYGYEEVEKWITENLDADVVDFEIGLTETRDDIVLHLTYNQEESDD